MTLGISQQQHLVQFTKSFILRIKKPGQRKNTRCCVVSIQEMRAHVLCCLLDLIQRPADKPEPFNTQQYVREEVTLITVLRRHICQLGILCNKINSLQRNVSHAF